MITPQPREKMSTIPDKEKLPSIPEFINTSQFYIPTRRNAIFTYVAVTIVTIVILTVMTYFLNR